MLEPFLKKQAVYTSIIKSTINFYRQTFDSTFLHMSIEMDDGSEKLNQFSAINQHSGFYINNPSVTTGRHREEGQPTIFPAKQWRANNAHSTRLPHRCTKQNKNKAAAAAAAAAQQRPIVAAAETRQTEHCNVAGAPRNWVRLARVSRAHWEPITRASGARGWRLASHSRVEPIIIPRCQAGSGIGQSAGRAIRVAQGRKESGCGSIWTRGKYWPRARPHAFVLVRRCALVNVERERRCIWFSVVLLSVLIVVERWLFVLSTFSCACLYNESWWHFVFLRRVVLFSSWTSALAEEVASGI